ncbi:cytokine receptor family member B12 isoform X2 [Alosa sapidissima]|uniref:cytokine receptor family member B12 isoform X2 n=1 Tax=Alosa sapidissima TaxID=34773 RepID=UPI001C0807EA|nr:cytokine receptor family member B12 isoform X2 [Alosa sapidissima]
MSSLGVLSGVEALCGLMWFIRCCLPSEGALSSPRNLKVELLDFHAKVMWESAPGNPSDTAYVLELQEFGKKWTKIEKCKTMMICDLDDFGTYDDLKNYFIRVKAVWAHESSNWTNASSFQPYSDCQFSPPLLNVMVQEGSILADIHHPVTKKVKELEFALYLYRNVSGQKTEVARKISAQGALSFPNLPPDRYCLRASVHNDQKDQLFAEECIVVHPADEWTPMRVALGVSFLLVLPVGLILIFVLCYLWPKYLKTPQALKVRPGESKLLEVIPDKTRAVVISHLIWGETDDCVSKCEEDNSSLAFNHKTDSTCIRDMSSEGEICLPPEEEDDDDEDDDKCTGSLRHSAGYGLEPDSSDEGAPVEEASSHAAARVPETEEYEENEHPSQYMERLMIGAQWQVHVPLDSLNSQPARSSDRLEFIEETAETPPNISSDSLESIEEEAETPPNSSSGYEPRQIPPNSTSGYEPRQIPPNSTSGYEPRQIPPNSTSGYEPRQIPPNSTSGYEPRQIPPNSTSGYEPRQIPPNSTSGYEPRQIPPNSTSGYEPCPLICYNSDEGSQ